MEKRKDYWYKEKWKQTRERRGSFDAKSGKEKEKMDQNVEKSRRRWKYK